MTFPIFVIPVHIPLSRPNRTVNFAVRWVPSIVCRNSLFCVLEKSKLTDIYSKVNSRDSIESATEKMKELVNKKLGRELAGGG